MKKNTATKFLSVLLSVLMLLSVFAIISVNAEETQNVATDREIIWSLDFDDYTSGADVTAYLASKGWTFSDFGGTKIDNGKLKSYKTWGTCQYNAKAEDNFRDLFYGLYKNADGSYLNVYYMDVDYKLISSNETKSGTFTGKDASGNDVTYEIYTPYRGNSYFNPLADSSGSGYSQFLFSISPTGYLYTPYESGNLTAYSYADKMFTTASSDDIKYFTYSRKVNGAYTVTKQPVTEEAWNQMVVEAGAGITLDSWNRINTGTNGYQMELGKEYTIRVKFSVDSTRTVVATTYVKPKGSNEPFSEVGQAKYKCSEAGKGEKTSAIRFFENQQEATLDNIKFARFDACDSEHEFLMNLSRSENANGFEICNHMKCFVCGEEWYDYSGQTAVQNFDFAAMTSEEYSAFLSEWKNQINGTLTFNQGEGLAFVTPANAGAQSGPDLTLKTPIKNKYKDYRVTFTAKINTIPVDQTSTSNGVTTITPGSSFFTDRVGDTGGNAWNVLLRMGRNADYDTTKQGWLKMRDSNGGTSWSNYESVYTIKEGETYTFSLVLKPSVGEYDVYVDGNYVGTGGLNVWNGISTRIFRIGNQMHLDMLLKDYRIAEIENNQTYTLINGSEHDFSLTKDTLRFTNNATHGALASNYISPTNPSDSTAIYIEDNDYVLGSTPYTLSFDFMMSDNGNFKDSQSTSTDLWSLISWLNSVTAGSTTYGTMVRIGGIDNNADKAGFEKFFVVMNNNNGATVTEDNGNQSYTTAAGGETVGYYSDHNAVYTFEAGEWVTFTIAVNPINGSAYLYANGELVGVAAKSAFGKTAGTVLSRLRIGDDYRKFEYNWAIKDISLELTPDTPAEVKDSGTVFNMDFGKGYKVDNGTTYNLGSTSYNGVTVQNTFKDSDTAEGYVNFTADLYKNLFNVSLTSKIGENEYYNHVEGAKYSIETKFAIKKSGEYTTVVRLSKYHDNNAVQLIQRIPSGLQAITLGGTLDLYTVEAGEYVRPKAQYEDKDLVNGRVAESNFVKLVVVIDESDDTFSVYINDKVAFYKNGNAYKEAIDLQMKVTTGANSLTTLYPNAPESKSWSGLYKDIPRKVTISDTEVKDYGTSGLSTVNYVRFFQNAQDFCVQNIKITKISDGLNYIGSQIRTESEIPLAFDVRFVFGTDNIYVDSIEYDILAEVNGVSQGTGKTVASDTVYRSIYSSEGDIKSWKIGEGDYFSVFSVNGVELAPETTVYTFKITPYLKEYNAESGKFEKNIESATVTHIIKINGLGKVLSYDTEIPEGPSAIENISPSGEGVYRISFRNGHSAEFETASAETFLVTAKEKGYKGTLDELLESSAKTLEMSFLNTYSEEEKGEALSALLENFEEYFEVIAPNEKRIIPVQMLDNYYFQNDGKVYPEWEGVNLACAQILEVRGGDTVELLADGEPHKISRIFPYEDGVTVADEELHNVMNYLVPDGMTHVAVSFVNDATSYNISITSKDGKTKVGVNRNVTDDLVTELATGKPVVYIPNLVGESASLKDDYIKLQSNHIINDKVLTFTFNIDELKDGEVIGMGHGETAYGGSGIEITKDRFFSYNYAAGRRTPLINEEHGIYISGDVTVRIKTDLRTAVVTIETADDRYVSTNFQWFGRNGEIFARSIGAELKNAKLEWACLSYENDVWFFGDSFFDTTTTYRWPYYMVEDGYTDFFFNGHPGRNTESALEDFKKALEFAIPKYVVWCMGMNNKDNETEISPTYKAATDEMLAICEKYGITPILSTIPNVPAVINVHKNEWVKSSGYRYVDFAKAVNGEEKGSSWDEGMLGADNVHPAPLGAEALYKQLKKDIYDILENKTTYTPITQVPYKALGRTQYVGNTLAADWSAAGIEFAANCFGDVSIDLTMTETGLFTIVIDGVEYKDVALNNGTNVIATELAHGKHTFKIMNQGGYPNTVGINGITLDGTFCPKSEDGKLLIEFIGDSITHGCGLGSEDYTATTNDGTLTYAFIAAKELGADYTVMANGGMGVKWGSDYDAANPTNHSMAKYPYLNDTARPGIKYDGYEDRTADIVVIGLSTNDNYRFQLQYNAEKTAYTTANPTADADAIAAHMAEFKTNKLAELGAELELLIAEIEKNHGKDVPIVLARGMMEFDSELYLTSVTYMTDLIEKTWGGKYGDHRILVAYLTPDRTGYQNHPTREGAAQQGRDLADFITENFADLLTKQ